MKPLSAIEIAKQYMATQFNGYSTMKYIDRLLQALITPDIEGTPLNSIGDYNITHDGNGNIIITVTLLENSLTLKDDVTPLTLKNDAGVLKISVDDGETWVELITQTELNALPNWDTDQDGIVDEAEGAYSLILGDGAHAASEFLRDAEHDPEGVAAVAEAVDDGVNIATAAEVRSHLDNVTLHVGVYQSVDVFNQFLALSSMQTTRQYLLHGWSDSFFNGDFLDPASQDYILSAGKILSHGEIVVFDADIAFGTGSSSSYTERSRIPAALLLASGGNIRLEFDIGAAAQLRVFVGHKGVGAYDFDGNQVQIFKDAVGTIAFGDAVYLSDLADFALDAAKDLIIAGDCINGWRSWSNGAVGGCASAYYTNGTADVELPGSGGARGAIVELVKKIYTYGGLGDLSLIFLPFAAPSAPTAGRCLVHVNPIEEITPGTDLKIYQAADNASPVWEEFGSITSQELADETVLLDMEANFANSGVTPTLKIETPTGKEIEILAVEHLFTL